MNSSATSSGRASTPSECELYIFLGGRLDHSTPEAYAFIVFITVMGFFTCPLTVVLNVLVMIAVMTKPRLKAMSNVVLGCLATTDSLVGLIGPLLIAMKVQMLQEEASSAHCTVLRLSTHLFRVFVAASLFHMVLMNVERYIAIKHSFAHITMVTKARILGSSAAAWIATLFLTIPLAIVDDNIYLTVNNIVLFLSLATIIFCQVVVYCETRRHERQIAAQQVSVEARQKFLNEKKAFKLTTTLLLILVLTYSPIIIVRILIVKSVINSVNVAYIAFFAAIVILDLNSLINPIVYCVRVRQFRVAFIEILLRKTNGQAEDMERKVLGKLNAAVAPLEEGQDREEGQKNRPS